MNDQPCSEFADLLVDYADGELAGPQRRRVTDHLAECARCRAELRLLERSLELARDLWREAEAANDRPAAAGPILAARLGTLAGRHPGSRRRWAIGAAAAAVLLLLAVWATWLAVQARSGTRPTVAVNGQEAPTPPAPTAEEIEQFISRQTRSARLAAAVRLLATEPGLKQYRAEAQHYLAEVSAGPGWDPRAEQLP